MFGDHKLLRNGAEAQAVVMTVAYRSMGPGRLGSWHLELTVPFPDGPDGSLSCRVDEKHLPLPSPGELVPVRYDATDRSKIVVDIPALEARSAANAQVFKQNEADRAQRVVDAVRNSAPGTMELGPLTPPDPAEDPRIGIVRMSIRSAQRRGDLAEVNRLNAQLVQLQSTGSTTPAAHTPDPLDRIRKLADLHDCGALTDAEFATEKAKILNGG